MKMISTSEKEIQAGGLDILRFHGLEMFRRNTGAMRAEYKGKSRLVSFAEPGAADSWGVEPKTGIHWEVEFKAPGERPTLAQVNWLMRLHRAGSIAFWIDDLTPLEGIVTAILDCGYRILYLPSTRVYSIRDPKFPKELVRVTGPSGDFDLVHRSAEGVTRCKIC
jgi:hypothetical protein